MASVNKVILLGNLGRDPETRYTTGGDAVTNLSIATSEQWKDKSGEKQERTEWHRVVLFGRQAEVAGEYLKKGRSVYIEGRLQTRKYTDKDGVERYSTERGWQDESKSSASRVEPTNRYAEPSDTRADAQQMWRGKFVAHAMETGAVANAAVNTPRMDARQPPADATVPLASLSPAQQNAYYESIARDAKP